MYKGNGIFWAVVFCLTAWAAVLWWFWITVIHMLGY
jgi:hypothetical protein